jgi:hypothetical protein
MADSGLPVETSAPLTTPAKPKTTQSKNKQDSTRPSPTTGSQDSKENIGNVVSAVRGTQLQHPDGMPAPVATKTLANSKSGPWDGVAAIVSMFLPKGSRPSDTPEGHDRPPNDPVNGVVISVGSGVHTVISSHGSIVLDGTPLVDGQATIISSQTISAKSGTVFVNGVSQHPTMLERPSAPQSSSNSPGQEHTGSHQADDTVHGDRQNSNPSKVTAVSQGANNDVDANSPDSGMHAAVFTVNGHIYGAESKSGSLQINGAPVSVGQKITINGDVLTISSHAISFQGTTIALPGGRPEAATPTAGANVIINGETITALMNGADVVLAGNTLTVGEVATISGTRISVASDGIVVGSSTAAFHTIDGSTADTGTAITIDGKVYSVHTMAGTPGVVFLAGQTLRQGGPAATIDGQVITNGLNGVSVIQPTASAELASATNSAETLLVIDGTTYTATPVSGESGVYVLQGQTLSVGGSAVTVAGHMITEGSNGISVVSSTSPSLDAKSKSPSSTEVSGASATEESASTSSEESSASVQSYRSGYDVMSIGILFAMFMSL